MVAWLPAKLRVIRHTLAKLQQLTKTDRASINEESREESHGSLGSSV